MKNVKSRKCGIILSALIVYTICIFLLAMRIQFFIDTHDITILKITPKQVISPLPKSSGKTSGLIIEKVAHAEGDIKTTPPPVVVTDVKTLVLSYFPKDQQASVEELIQRESSWNPDAVNKSSGATGLFQALPWSKTGCDTTQDIKCQSAWGYAYIQSRYSGDARIALQFQLKNGWY